MINKETYKMKGLEYFPILGLKKYANRLKEQHKKEGVPKRGTEEFAHLVKRLDSSLTYHIITGTSSVIILGVTLYQGLEKLIN